MFFLIVLSNLQLDLPVDLSTSVACIIIQLNEYVICQLALSNYGWTQAAVGQTCLS